VQSRDRTRYQRGYYQRVALTKLSWHLDCSRAVSTARCVARIRSGLFGCCNGFRWMPDGCLMKPRAWLVSLIWLTFLGGPTPAQDLLEPPTSLSTIPDEADISAAPKDSAGHHLRANGKPCITIDEIQPRSPSTTAFFEHWVRATNRCGQYIKLRVCRHGTEECIAMNVPPWDSKNGLVGISATTAGFRYDARERF
jgi:hypothetical protein